MRTEDIEKILSRTTKDILLMKIPVKFRITTLEDIICFLCKKTKLRTRKTMMNFKKVFSLIDDEEFKEDNAVGFRVWIIRTMLTGYLDNGYENPKFIIDYCKEQSECTDAHKRIMDEVANNSLNTNEIKKLIRDMEDVLNYGYSLILKEAFNHFLSRYDSGDFRRYRDVKDKIYALATKVINIDRSVRDLGVDSMFSLEDDVFETVVDSSVNTLRDRNRIFPTGCKRWNTLLSPGYMGKRLYTYLALPGGGKSTILLKSALDIKKYSKKIETNDPDKRPAILFITMENFIEETIERIFNMTVTGDDIRNYTPQQVIKKLRKEGELVLTDDNPIDIIIRYYPNHSITTGDLYNIIDDLSDDGVEVITLILDYMKRILPQEKPASTKEEMKNITNELKTIANIYNIPVITAQQLNRASSSIVDEAKRTKSEDLIKLIQRDGIADAWEIQENSDVVIILLKEQAPDGSWHMGFKLLKRRYKSCESKPALKNLEITYQPLDPDNDYKIMDDYDLEDVVYGKTSLKALVANKPAGQFESLDIEEGTYDISIQKEAERANAVVADEKDKSWMDNAIDDDYFEFNQVVH